MTEIDLNVRTIKEGGRPKKSYVRSGRRMYLFIAVKKSVPSPLIFFSEVISLKLHGPLYQL